MKKIIIKIFKIILLILIAASIYMRATLFHIGFEYDELFTAVTTDPFLAFSWIYSHYLMADVHPPLYNFLLWIWNHFVPYGPEIWLRLPSFVFGMSALCIAWFFFPKRFGRTARIVFLSLLSCNLYTMGYSQSARSYMLVLLLVVPLTFMFLQLSREMDKKHLIPTKNWVYFAGISLLLCWTHYFGALLCVVFFIVLLGKAIYYRTNIKTCILAGGIMLLLFLPWLIPNLLAQMDYQRFAGNWWNNNAPYWYAMFCILAWFWTGSLKGAIIMFFLVVIAFVYRKIIYRKSSFFYWPREQMVLAISLLLFIFCIALISIKTFMFVTRYFVTILPVVYLLISLFLSPLLRKNICINLLLVLFLLFEMQEFWNQHNQLLKNGDEKMPIRKISQMYRDEFSSKEMLVVAMEAFPPVTMPSLYGFYVNRVYHLQMPIIELYSLDEKTRDELLKRKSKEMIWMPNCTDRKLSELSIQWKRPIISERLGTICFLRFES